MSGNTEQHDGLPLTREEARRVLRVNETTLDSWLRNGRLESVGYVDEGQRETMLLVCDDELQERASTRLQETHIDLTVDSLPARARYELLRIMMSRRDARSTSNTRVQHPLARSATRPELRRRRIEGQRTASGRSPAIAREEMASRSVVRTESRQKTRSRRSRIVTKGMQSTRPTKRRIERRRGKSPQAGFNASDELVEMLFPPELLKTPRRRRSKSTELSALKELIETTEQPEAVEELWGEELLSLIGGAAEALALDVAELVEADPTAGELARDDADDVEFLVVDEVAEEVEVTEPEVSVDLVSPQVEEAVAETSEPLPIAPAQVFEPCAGDLLPTEACWEGESDEGSYGFDPDGPRVFVPELGPVEAMVDAASDVIPRVIEAVLEPEPSVGDEDLLTEIAEMLEELASSDFSTVVDEQGAIPPRPRDQVFDWVASSTSTDTSRDSGDDAVTDAENDLAAPESAESVEEQIQEPEAEVFEENDGAVEELSETTVEVEAEVEAVEMEATDTEEAVLALDAVDDSLEADLFAEPEIEPSTEFGSDDTAELASEFDDSSDTEEDAKEDVEQEAETQSPELNEEPVDEVEAEADTLDEGAADVVDESSDGGTSSEPESSVSDEAGETAEAAPTPVPDVVAAAFDFGGAVASPVPVLEAEAVLSMSLSDRSSRSKVSYADADIVPTDEELADLLASPVVLSHGATNLLADAETAAVLRGIEQGVDKLAKVVEGLQKSADSATEAPDFQPVIDALREDIAVARGADSELAKSLSLVAEQVAELHSGVQATNKVAVSSVSAVQGIRKEVERDLLVRRVLSNSEVVQGKAEDQGTAMSTMMIGMAVLLMTWAVTFYVKTGDLRLTVGALVMANLVGCATIIYTKSGKVL